MSRAEAIIRAVCSERQLAVREVLARKGRPQDKLLAARIEIAQRIRATTRMSLPQIGRAMGNRHHATILYYLRKDAA